MPLPRLDDDQKYWEERCHELEADLAEARLQTAERILIRTTHVPDKGLVNVYATTEDYVALERQLTEAQREVERLKGEQSYGLLRKINSIVSPHMSVMHGLDKRVERRIAQAREKAVVEIEQSINNLPVMAYPRSGAGTNTAEGAYPAGYHDALNRALGVVRALKHQEEKPKEDT